MALSTSSCHTQQYATLRKPCMNLHKATLPGSALRSSVRRKTPRKSLHHQPFTRLQLEGRWCPPQPWESELLDSSW